MNTLKARSSNNVFRNHKHTLFPLYVTSLIVQKYSHQDFSFAENWTLDTVPVMYTERGTVVIRANNTIIVEPMKCFDTLRSCSQVI